MWSSILEGNKPLACSHMRRKCFYKQFSTFWIILLSSCNAVQLTSGHCQYSILCTHTKHTIPSTNSWIHFLKWVYLSGQHFCSKLQRDTLSFYFFMAPERLCWAEDHSVADGWLRCTNKTATLTDRGDAYHPLRGCLTAGVVVWAGHIPPRFHTYCIHIFLQPPG